MFPRAVVSLLVAGLSLGAISCGGGSGPAVEVVDLHGAGASFPQPLYDKWFKAYVVAHPTVRIDYQQVGSGAGVTQFTNKTVDFGASDSAMTDDEIAKVDRGVQLLPMTAGSIVLAYNLPDLTSPLRLSRAAYTGIFLGKITKWNDPAIAKLNAGVTLPATDITVAHRAEGSGTTFIWVDYLSKVSPEWKSKVGAAASVNWPTGVGGRGNEGVSGLVAQTPGAIGYVELIYALQNKMACGSVQNASGEFVKASVDAVTKAAAGAAANMPADFRVSITNAPGKGVYPISSFTWILLYENAKDKAQAKTMVDFMKWALADGQRYCADLGYAPLPASVVKLEMAALATIKVS
jgi:phosphate transport system substrate-binding protein